MIKLKNEKKKKVFVISIYIIFKKDKTFIPINFPFLSELFN